MTKSGYQKKIKNACTKVGTYNPAFDITIDTLASIYVKIEQAEKEFTKCGCTTLVMNTKGDWVQNPLLKIIKEQNTLALQYLSQLGLTAKGLKQIDESSMKEKRQNTLVSVLDKLDAKK